MQYCAVYKVCEILSFLCMQAWATVNVPALLQDQLALWSLVKGQPTQMIIAATPV